MPVPLTAKYLDKVGTIRLPPGENQKTSDLKTEDFSRSVHYLRNLEILCLLVTRAIYSHFAIFPESRHALTCNQLGDGSFEKFNKLIVLSDVIFNNR